MTARDSLEKIVEDMRRPITLHQCPACGGPHGFSDERQWARIADRIEALIPSKAERELLEAAMATAQDWEDVLDKAYSALRAERGKDA